MKKVNVTAILILLFVLICVVMIMFDLGTNILAALQ
jgi:hypothetical protein